MQELKEEDRGLRIAYVSYADYGGPLVHTREFVNAFGKIVPELVVCCPYLDKELSYTRPRNASLANRVFAYFPSWARRLKLEFYQLRKLLRDYGTRHEYAKRYRKSKLDMLIIRHDAFVFGPIWAAVKAGLPYVLEVNGVLVKHSPDRITRWFEKYVFKHASGIFAVTDSLGKMLVDAGASQAKIRIITNGVRIDRFAAATGAGVPMPLKAQLRGCIVIGYVGTFADYHDTKLLVDSFAIARKKVENLRLVLVGEGRNDRVMKDYIGKCRLQADIFFTGKVGYDLVPDYLQLFDIAANPVRKIYEDDFHGAPIKVFEYMAAALPIVLTDMPNLRRLLEDAVVFAPEGQPEIWGKIFIELARSEAMRRQKGEAGHSYLVEKDFTWNGNARRIYEFCRNILDQRGHRGSKA